jgi:alkanesulfonate monooxygenase SsuD/methylene tetrahydromethanopterin reductase-like flavin-dependent oxidoreductase (luciferase family)
VKIGIGLPNPVPDTPGRTLVDWARRAEERGFSSLATIDRIVYPSYESLISLAAAAGATERIGLLTNVLLAPTRNPILLAKETASVDQISGGRFILGATPGSRQDDFDATGQSFHDRGRRWDRALELIHRAWRGEPVAGSDKPVTPRPFNGERVPILIGGTSDKSIERAVRWGIGWTAGGGAADRVGPLAERVRRAWKEAGREGEPRIVALGYFALGEGAEDASAAYIREYYGHLGDWVETMVKGVRTTPSAVQETVKRFEDVGVDEFIFDPTVGTLDQVDRLAEAVL